MSLFSFFRKNKQETVTEDSAFHSRAESESESATVRPRKRKSAGKPAAESAGNAPVDPVLPEKKRARRRLVGAVALVLAVVIGLPMVLDSEPKSLPDDMTIEIPSKERLSAAPGAGAPATRVTDGKLPAAGTQAPAAAGLDQKEEIIDVGPAAASRTAVAANAVESPPARPKPEPVTVAKAEPKSVVPKVEPKVAPPRPEPKITVAKAEPKVVQPKPEQKPEQKPEPKVVAVKPVSEDAADARHTKFTVQVAALATMEKADELRNRLKDAGIASYSQKIGSGSGERIRIRIGPLNSREDADRLRARLALLGLSGTLIPSPL